MTSKQSINGLIKIIELYDKKADFEMIRIVYDYAKDAHEGQFRKSGEPYIVHPLAAAYILAEMSIDPVIIMATLLHDVPEDTDKTLEDLEKNFGKEIASLVEGITKLGKLKYRGVERYIENLRKMFIAMAEDVRVMIIKFADRIHNLTTLDALPPQKRYRIALESLEIYAPIANRLGMDEMKGQLEDLSFKFVYPKEYERVKKISIISIHGRNKKLYSLYKKLIDKNNELGRIYDIVAIRIIVDNVAKCYATLGILHSIWKPIKGRIKDYIAQPKPNGYQSLHTTVFAEGGEPVEFQIRTLEMNEDAEYGIAAHWHYDENGSRRPEKDIKWVQELAQIQKDILNKLSDLEEMKVDFLQTRIFVLTPKGDVIDLPEGATPVDFAYHIHSDIGDKCIGSRVNERMVSLDTELKNGDIVEIIIDKNRKGPSSDWIKFVKTHTAKEHIINYTKSKNSGIARFFNILPKKEK